VKDFIHSFIEKIPFIVFSLLISFISFKAQKTTGALELMAVTPLTVRVLVAFRALIMYLWKMLIPVDLLPLYPYPQDVSLLSGEYLFAIALSIGITTLCIFYAGKQKALLSAWSYYVITLLPVLGIVQIGSFSMADRFTYLPSFGPFLLAGLAAARTGSQAAGKAAQRLTAAVAIALAISLSYGTLKQITIWKSGVTLWSYFIDKEPRRFPEAYLNLGMAFGEEGKFDRAIEAFSAAVTINPKLGTAYLNRGMAFKQMGELDRAIEDYSTALSVKPDYVEAYNDRGSAFNRKGQFDRAIEDFNAAIAIDPTVYPAYINRGISYKEKGELDRAIRDYSKALSLNPDFVKGYIGRGDLYMKKGSVEFAVKDYHKACDMGNEIGCSKALLPFEQR
jgi:Tfp pilus assembly protein PilF